MNFSGSNFIITKDILLEKLKENNNNIEKAIEDIELEIQNSFPSSVISFVDGAEVVAEKTKNGSLNFIIPIKEIYNKFFSN